MCILADDFTNHVCAFVCANQYGGEKHLDAPPRELLLAQTEDYVEYSRHGAVLKGLEKAVARSKYEEDVLINNHTVRTAEHTVAPVKKKNFPLFVHLHSNKILLSSVFGAPTGRTAAGDTSAATPWSNRVTAQERLELE